MILNVPKCIEIVYSSLQKYVSSYILKLIQINVIYLLVLKKTTVP